MAFVHSRFEQEKEQQYRSPRYTGIVGMPGALVDPGYSGASAELSHSSKVYWVGMGWNRSTNLEPLRYGRILDFSSRAFKSISRAHFR